MLPTTLLTVLSSLLLALLTTPAPASGQLQTYTSGPSISHTFDVEVITSELPPNTSSFAWQRGLQPHEGMVLFNGAGDYIDLYQLMDDYGRLMPREFARSMSFEWWVKYESLNAWSRILDCGNGPFADNVIVSNVEQTNNLRAAFYYDGETAGLTSVANNAIKPFTWQHVVVTVRQKRRGDLDSANSAEINIYVDGALYSNNSNTRLPRQVSREYCFIGMSEWYLFGQSTGDGFFSGWLDDFFYYDYPLSAEAVLAHYVLPRPPVYELTFSSDPRLIQWQNYSYTYDWVEVDPRDTQNITRYHNGFLNLTGDSYIDLGNRTGNSSVGVAPPPVLFGTSGGNGTLDEGWSFEFLFKPALAERYAKLFDTGNGEYQDNFLIGYRATDPILQLETYLDGNHTTLRLINNVNPARWYHLLIVMRPIRVNNVPRYANVTAYVDGVVTAQTRGRDFPWPAAIPRRHTYIGKSNWVADEFFDLLLDTFRIYDYALLPSEARDLYTVTHEELPRESNSNQTIPYTYHTGPVTALTFDTSVPVQDMTEGTNFFWQNGNAQPDSQTWPHLGLAEFRGNRQVNGGITGNYINLRSYPGRSSTPAFPLVLGGSMSFEVWAKWNQLAHYSRILDIGASGGRLDNNIILGQIGDGTGIMFEVYSADVRSWLHIDNVNPVGEWVHIVASVEQLRRDDTWSSTSALLTMYINGKIVGRNLGYLPQRMARPSAFIGRSNWAPADAYFNGLIDAFYYYDYALQAEQVAAHYLLPLPPVFELAFTKDPRVWVGDTTMPLNAFTYQWHDFNASDFVNGNTTYHNGYLVFDNEEYVDLTATTGPSSIGTTLPSVLFGQSRGRYIQGGRWNGWSIEVLVKMTKAENGAKVFSFSNGMQMDEVDLGYNWAQTNELQFVSYGGSDGKQPSNFACITDVQLHVWYHILIVLSNPTTSGRADIQCYVDGVAGVAGNDAVYMPRAVARNISYLSRSVWIEDTMDMHLDTFRIYDIAIDASYAERLYALTTSDVTNLVRPLYTSRPILAYTFDYDPATTGTSYGDGTSYGWEAQDPNSRDRRGIAIFDGRSNWINMLQYPDDKGTQFPIVIGGDSMAFEVWVRWDGYGTWARIFDLGNGPEGDNILLGQRNTDHELAFHVYRPNATEPSSQLDTAAGANGAFQTGRWYHVVASIEDLSDWPCLNVSADSVNATYMTIYVNGQLMAQRRGLLPRRLVRNVAYMGKSHWGDQSLDSLFQGRIDAFYFYDHALSTEQVNVHRVLPKPPVFDLSFSADPRWLLSHGGDAAQYTYAWQEYDPTDAYNNATQSHGGHLVLTGAANSYVNLSQPRGYSSVGTTLPQFGGNSDGVGVNHENRGWSFEMIVKLDTVAKWAKFIDLGQPADVAWRIDNVQFGYADESRSLEFRVYDSLRGIANDEVSHREMTVVENVVLGQWYHIVVAMEITSVSDRMATWIAYVDGAQKQIAENMYLPRATARPSQLIGASNWINSNPPDSPFAAKIDAVRLYDYNLTPVQVFNLHRLATDPSFTPAPLVRPNEPVCASPPPSYPSSSTAAPPQPSTGRPGGASSSSGAVRPFVTSSSAKKCKSYATGWEPNCVCLYGGRYPNNCYCSETSNEVFPNCGDDSGDDGEYSSSTGVAAASGPPSGLIAGIVVALLVVAAVAGFVYFRYFRTPPKGSDDMALLGAPPAKFATSTTTGQGSVRQSASTSDESNGAYHRHVDAGDKPTGDTSVELL